MPTLLLLALAVVAVAVMFWRVDAECRIREATATEAAWARGRDKLAHTRARLRERHAARDRLDWLAT